MRHVYGPVTSGRLGRSLGIDPFCGEKTCNFDCTFCQLGARDVRVALPARYAAVDEVVEQARAAVEGAEIDWVTVSGSGEPTMHPELGAMIDGLKRATGKRVAVVTNGSRLFRREVREALADADAVLPTLAAAEPGVHWLMHRPRGVGAFSRHVAGMMTFRRSYRGLLWLEVMLVGGVNDDPEHLAALGRLVKQLRPDEVHLTRPTRPGAESWVREPSFDAVIRAMSALQGMVVKPGRERPEPEITHDGENLLDSIERAVCNHPIRESEILAWLRHAGVDEPARELDRLASRENVRRVPGDRGVFLARA